MAATSKKANIEKALKTLRKILKDLEEGSSGMSPAKFDESLWYVLHLADVIKRNAFM